MEEYPKRKTIRLKNYDYNSPGAYFITICTKNREEMLSEIIVGTGVSTVRDRKKNRWIIKERK